MELPDNPNEIWHQVFSLAGHSTLLPLCRVSKRFHAISVSHLYRDPFNLSKIKRLKRLHRTLMDSQPLADCVRVYRSPAFSSKAEYVIALELDRDSIPRLRHLMTAYVEPDTLRAFTVNCSSRMLVQLEVMGRNVPALTSMALWECIGGQQDLETLILWNNCRVGEETLPVECLQRVSTLKCHADAAELIVPRRSISFFHGFGSWDRALGNVIPRLGEGLLRLRLDGLSIGTVPHLFSLLRLHCHNLHYLRVALTTHYPESDAVSFPPDIHGRNILKLHVFSLLPTGKSNPSCMNFSVDLQCFQKSILTGVGMAIST